jgi:hypothetical protein
MPPESVTKKITNGTGPWWWQFVERVGLPVAICMGVCIALMWAGNEYVLGPAKSERAVFVESLTNTQAALTATTGQLSEAVVGLKESLDDQGTCLHAQTQAIEETNECMQRAEKLMAPVPEERRRHHAEQTGLLTEIRDRLPPTSGDGT